MATAVSKEGVVLEGVRCHFKTKWDYRLHKTPGRFFFLCGASAVGKSTLVGTTIHTMDCLTPMSYADRDHRDSDQPWEITTMSPADLDHMLEQRNEAWLVEAHGRRYATLAQDFLAGFCAGGIHVANVVPLVAWEIPAEFLETSKVIPVYLVAPPENVLRARFESRGDMTSEKIESRLAQCASWNEWVESQCRVNFHLIDGALPKEKIADQFAKILRRFR